MVQMLRRAMKLARAQLTAAEAAEVKERTEIKDKEIQYLKDINAVPVTRRMPGTMNAPEMPGMPGMPNEKPVIRMEKTVVPHNGADKGTDGAAARVRARVIQSLLEPFPSHLKTDPEIMETLWRALAHRSRPLR
eukprot:Skav226504  [mRNA]  locus=scaffold2090:25483:27716:- [translate_table: standard]